MPHIAIFILNWMNAGYRCDGLQVYHIEATVYEVYCYGMAHLYSIAIRWHKDIQ